MEGISKSIEGKDVVKDLMDSSSYIQNTLVTNSKFKVIYTLNYDTIPLLANALEKSYRNDGFDGTPTQLKHNGNSFLKVRTWNTLYNNYEIVYLHGAVHLINYNAGVKHTKVGKITSTDNNKDKLSKLANRAMKNHVFPVCVTASNSSSKLHSILANPYLHNSYKLFQSNSTPLVVFGASLEELDSHISDAIVTSSCPTVYYGLHFNSEQPDFRTVHRILALRDKRDTIKRISDTNLPDLCIKFFNSEIMGV